MSYKVLGQSAPTADTDTNLYNVPPTAESQAVVSSLTVCNRASSPALFRVAVRPNSATLANEHYIYYDVEIQGNSTFVFTGGITLGADAIITVRASTADVSFSLFGKEI